MLDYNLNGMSEIINSAICINNGNKFDIKEIFTAINKNGTITKEDIWPADAVKFKLETNYDYTNQKAKLPNSAYDGPVISLNTLNRKSSNLKLTVTPYPKTAKWTFRHSTNISAPNGELDNIYSGKKTIVISNLQLTTNIESDEQVENVLEYCYIEVVSPIANTISNSPKYQFFIKIDNDTSDDSAEIELTDPLVQWTFESDEPLVDDIANVSLATYKNPLFSMLPETSKTRLTLAGFGATGLYGLQGRAVDQSIQKTCLLINNKVYSRLDDYDDENKSYAKFCWNNVIKQDEFVYVNTLEPDVDTLVYSSDETNIGVVTKKFTANANFYEADDIGFDINDPNTDYTLAFYVRSQGENGIKIGFKDYFEVTGTYNNLYSNIGKTSNASLIPIPKMNISVQSLIDNNLVRNKLCYIVLTKTRPLDASDPANEYTEEKKRGFILYRGLYVYRLGYPYIRDESQDSITTNNVKLYAFTFDQTALGTTRAIPKINNIEYPTVWFTNDTYEKIYDNGNGDTQAYLSDGTKILYNNKEKEVKASGNIVYKLRYYDYILMTTEKDGDSTYLNPYVGEFNTQGGKTSPNQADLFTVHGKYVRIGYYFLNGELRARKMTIRPTVNDTPSEPFRIEFNNFGTDSTFSAVDDVRIYDRFLTQNEMKAASAEILKENNNANKKPELKVNYLELTSMLKIKVKDTWYYYDPDLTYFNATNENDKACCYGWRRLSGENPITTIWTTQYDLIAPGAQCITVKGGKLNQDYVIQEKDFLLPSELPIKCDLIPYIIDNKTIAIVINTHDEVIRCMRRIQPNIDAIAYNSEHGYISDYSLGFTYNCAVWRAHNVCQPIICERADDANGIYWKVDSNTATVSSRCYITPCGFQAHAIQWKNCTPSDEWYSSHAATVANDGRAPEIMQIVYLTLQSEMAEGSTHTIEWCGNSCTFTYDNNFAVSTIKINQEGYMPWDKAKYAYLGRWLGSAGKDQGNVVYTPEPDNRTFYVVPYSKPTIENAVLSGTMIQRCTVGLNEVVGTICARNVNYTRTVTSDIGNACAWVNNGQNPKIIYTDNEFPTIGDKARKDYNNYDTQYDITNINIDYSRICSDRIGVSSRPNRPLVGENVFQMDFTNLSVVKKDAIELDGTKYFRDEVEDFSAGYIIVDDTVYDRNCEKDTCNAYAWSKYDNNNTTVLSTIYTDTHIPTTLEKARIGFDDYSVELNIEDVVEIKLLGWTTERITERDYDNYQTIWTTNEIYTPSITNVSIYTKNGFESGKYIDHILYEQETRDIAGFYQIYVPNIGWSFKFLIHPDSLFHAYYTVIRGLFHQRSGCNKVKHPYTNWEYLGYGHEILFEGNFCPLESLAADVNYVFEVDSNTHEIILDEFGGRKPLSGSGKAFAQNTESDKFNIPPMYGVFGGWFDAADFDMREVHIPIVEQLCEAYIRCPDNFSDDQLDLPESGDGIPDILSEALWGAQLWLNSQEPNGAIHGWFEAGRHEGDWPWESSMKYYSCCPSMRHSMRWAYSAAKLARAMKIAASRSINETAKEKMEEYVKVYTDSACAAFRYAVKELHDLYIKDPDTERIDETSDKFSVTTYFKSQEKTWAFIEWCSVFNYDDNPRSGLKSPFGTDLFKAVCALYALTNENRYKQYITDDLITSYIKFMNDNINSMNLGDYVVYEFLFDFNIEFPSFTQRIFQQYINAANIWMIHQKRHPYRWLFHNPGNSNIVYSQFGAAHPDNRANILYAAYIIAKNYQSLNLQNVANSEDYRSAIFMAFDHVYGCNNLGRSWVVGSGYVYPATHLDSWLPKYKVNNDYWSSRPGICPYYFSTNPPPYRNRQITNMLTWEGRFDQNSPKTVLNAIPGLVTAVGKGRDDYYFDCVPYTSASQLFAVEEQSVAAMEYTIWETMSRKAMLLGLLLAKNSKPKFWYKQDAPLKTLQAAIRNNSYLI